ncbi:SDR family NAD(P)-dependent oxidoreductase [Streptomyces sp. SM11]|uniref:SDR family NAD(P)-dependent oxidoreductase n=1 Tax=Streptomyces sp. SM11 TaxID=565557 RepID=UPI000CD57BC5|nr:SDR family oxidoreductase [Streptomyces sp. SM11]
MAIKGTTVLITGAGAGIGLATARLAAGRGAHVVLTDRDEDAVRLAAESIGDRAEYRVLDVTDPASVDVAVGSLERVDHVFTSAAGITVGPFEELGEDDFRRFFEIKWWGQYRVLRAALPRIPRTTGSVTLMSGYLYRKPELGYSAFAGVNGAIEGLVKSLTQELAPLRVNALAPGPVDTHAARMPADEHSAYRESVSRRLPVARPGEADELAHAALFLMENTFTTGITLDVDGGVR